MAGKLFGDNIRQFIDGGGHHTGTGLYRRTIQLSFLVVAAGNSIHGRQSLRSLHQPGRGFSGVVFLQRRYSVLTGMPQLLKGIHPRAYFLHQPRIVRPGTDDGRSGGHTGKFLLSRAISFFSILPSRAASSTRLTTGSISTDSSRR